MGVMDTIIKKISDLLKSPEQRASDLAVKQQMAKGELDIAIKTFNKDCQRLEKNRDEEWGKAKEALANGRSQDAKTHLKRYSLKNGLVSNLNQKQVLFEYISDQLSTTNGMIAVINALKGLNGVMKIDLSGIQEILQQLNTTTVQIKNLNTAIDTTGGLLDTIPVQTDNDPAIDELFTQLQNEVAISNGVNVQTAGTGTQTVANPQTTDTNQAINAVQAKLNTLKLGGGQNPNSPN